MTLSDEATISLVSLIIGVIVNLPAALYVLSKLCMRRREGRVDESGLSQIFSFISSTLQILSLVMELTKWYLMHIYFQASLRNSTTRRGDTARQLFPYMYIRTWSTNAAGKYQFGNQCSIKPAWLLISPLLFSDTGPEIPILHQPCRLRTNSFRNSAASGCGERSSLQCSVAPTHRT